MATGGSKVHTNIFIPELPEHFSNDYKKISWDPDDNILGLQD